jgi:hypothetical protein
MSTIDNGLTLLEAILRKGTPSFKKDASACRRCLSSADEAKARTWLLYQLKKMENEQRYQWLPRQSGVILYTAGMIPVEQASRGVSVMFNQQLQITKV